MLVYKFDESGLFIGVDETELDPLESELQGKDVYLLPPNSTLQQPEQKSGYVPLWTGEVWELLEDNRGVQYWLPEDKYGDPARVKEDLGALPEGALLIAPQMTEQQKQAEIQANLTAAIQRVLDSRAQEFNYDSCLSVCSYSNSGVQKFDDEGQAFRIWRSKVWAKGYEILDAVKSGQREIPTEQQLLAELPELEIIYS